jgi:hypothetical protein
MIGLVELADNIACHIKQILWRMAMELSSLTHMDCTFSNADSLFLLKVSENKVDFETTKFVFGITRSLSSTTLLSFTTNFI